MASLHLRLEVKATELLLKELPYFNVRGDLTLCHRHFNNLVPTVCQTRNNLDKLTSLYDLDIFDLNNNLDNM